MFQFANLLSGLGSFCGEFLDESTIETRNTLENFTSQTKISSLRNSGDSRSLRDAGTIKRERDAQAGRKAQALC